MTQRSLSVLLFMGALAAQIGFARPAWREEAILKEQAHALDAEKQALLGRVAALERADVLRTRATRMELPPGTKDDGVGRLRRSLLESLRGQPVVHVRLAVAPARPPLAAEGRLQAEGSFADVVRLSGRLVRPGAGFVLKRLRMAPTPRGSLALEVEGLSVLEDPP